ncbi:putative invertase inhibitor [Elaeis guineensis]|uniref:Pectinesterase inhibitor 12-like n=1 Tax=Elaeis guineensis var. tenera TaxID=51953 RepID=A0A6I9SCW6_ELAGV|nr:pectinesterase inhibitor 12-like [Elaeis guineensis]
MKLLIFLYLSLLLSLHHATSFEDQQCSDPADIEDVCRTVTASMAASDYDFCVNTLKSEMESNSTDLHGLATLATRLAISHAMSIEGEIEELMDLESDPEIKENYNACLDAYNDAIDQLQDALDNLNSKLYFEGMSLLKSTLEGVERCKEAFKDAKTLPMMMEDNAHQRLANIAYLISASIE